MLTKEQRSMVMKLFREGMNISNISRKVGISRPSVYRVISSDVEKDADIQALEKKLRKTELQMKIRKLREPSMRRMDIDDLSRIVDRVIEYVYALCHTNPDMRKRVKWCFYCGEKLEFYERDLPNGGIEELYGCPKCRRSFPLP